MATGGQEETTMRHVINILFGTAASALAAWAYTVLGPFDVEVWQVIFIAGVWAFVAGYRTCMTNRYASVRLEGGTHVMTLDRKRKVCTTSPTRRTMRRHERKRFTPGRYLYGQDSSSRW